MKSDNTGMQLKHERILYSCLSIAACLVLMNMVYHKPDQKFGMMVIFLLLRYFALWGGAIILFCRLIFLIRRNESIIYITAGVLNIILGMIALILFVSQNMNMPILHLFLLNLLLGVIIISDCLFFKEIF